MEAGILKNPEQKEPLNTSTIKRKRRNTAEIFPKRKALNYLFMAKTVKSKEKIHTETIHFLQKGKI